MLHAAFDGASIDQEHYLVLCRNDKVYCHCEIGGGWAAGQINRNGQSVYGLFPLNHWTQVASSPKDIAVDRIVERVMSHVCGIRKTAALDLAVVQAKLDTADATIVELEMASVDCSPSSIIEVAEERPKYPKKHKLVRSTVREEFDCNPHLRMDVRNPNLLREIGMGARSKAACPAFSL